MTSKLVKLMAAAGVAAAAGWAGQAFAVEGNTPYLPGVSVGTPVGALPPPGFYASDDNVIINGGLRNNSGNNLPANVTAYLNIPAVLWAPGINILGATYAAVLIQPYSEQNLDLSGLGAGKSIEQGLFNTIIVPVQLSWNFHPFFVSTGVGIYADDGYTSSIPVPGGRKAVGIANDFWTFEPDVAVSYLEGGWDFTAKAVFDFNLKDDTTHYQSGTVFYLDLTAEKSIGKWIVGIGGNYTQQITKDTGFGAPSSAAGGGEVMHVLLGPLVGYNFGPAELDFKALFGVTAENTFNASFYHLSVSFPF
ncbi:MAG: transporter [Stellaceae bacterium]